MIEDLTLLTYTHSSCIDIHNIYLLRINKYFPEIKNKLLICDKDLSYKDTKTLVYDDNDYYSNQILLAIENINTDFFIYSQEDCILYDKVNLEEINYCISILKNDNSIPFIRLIWSGISNNYKKYNEKFYYIGNSKYYYSLQITIWRKNILKELYLKVKVKSIFEESSLSNILWNINKNGLVYYKKGKKIGNHYASIVYPYISTAIVKRKWNYYEYKKELDEIFREFNINPNIRGIYKPDLRTKLYRLTQFLKDNFKL
ncbi:MAG: hypothetical protein KatS3mg068_0015 [Candidatus Sericytochromatia bacterium]|nr:MAG: hypothetical protein KatS3mg068_0015 [Candidatus Sericytochromatia bacterium]